MSDKNTEAGTSHQSSTGRALRPRRNFILKLDQLNNDGMETEVSDLEDFGDSDDSDEDEDYVIESDHDTDSEQEYDENANDETDIADNGNSNAVNETGIAENENDDDDDEEMAEEAGLEPDDHRPRLNHDLYFYGLTRKKEKEPCFRWKKTNLATAGRTRQHNIIVQLPGLRPTARALGENPNPLQVWTLLFTEDMFQEVLIWTNRKITTMREKYKRKKLSFIQNIDLLELKAFVGLLLYTAIFKSNHESLANLWASDGTGRDIFRCTMTLKRFLFILSALRFDNLADREERKKVDKAAAISKLFNRFVENSNLCYSVGPNTCIDEMLVPFRGRCSFRMYLPKKPAKYGLKIMCLTDARTHYLVNAYIYSGKGSDGATLLGHEKKLLVPTQAVIRLVKPIEHSKRNVTADNWFSSIQLVQELLNRGLTYVGTLKKNKSEIPVEFKPDKDRPEKSALYGFTPDLTLVSYVPKPKKAVVLVSSMHHKEEEDPETKKPEIITYYNMTKGGVDAVDQKASNYSCSRRTQRWPLAIFFRIIDVSCGVNAFVLHQNFPNSQKMTRLQFIKDLAKDLTHPLLQRRLTMVKNLPRELVRTTKRIIGVEEPQPIAGQVDVFEVRKTCDFCPPRLKRKTKNPCQLCGKAICGECTKRVCVGCFRDRDGDRELE